MSGSSSDSDNVYEEEESSIHGSGEDGSESGSEPSDDAEAPTTYKEFLAPLEVPSKYVKGFDKSGIAIEDLSVITRDDLCELVGITDRVHQIRIMAHIKRTFTESGEGRVRGKRNADRSVAKPSKSASSKGLNFAMKGLKAMSKFSDFGDFE